MIKNINIKNFRLFDNIEINNLKKINFFIGDNNCGKTSILEALLLITDMGNVAPLIDINNSRGIPVITENTLSNYFYNFDMSNKVSISIESDKGQYEFNLEKAEQETNTTLTPNPLHSITGGTMRELVKYCITNNNTNEIKKGFISTDNNGIITIKHHKKYLGNFPYIYDMFDDKQKLVKLISDIKQKRKDKDFIESLKKFDSKINSVEIIVEDNIIVGTQVAIGIDGIDKLVPLALFGGGTKKYLKIISSLISNNLKCLMIDEIENGLYFENIKKLLKSLIEFAIKKDIQLFITTHSIEVLQYLSEIVKQDSHINSSDLAVINIQKIENVGYKAFSYDCESFIHHIENQNEVRGK